MAGKNSDIGMYELSLKNESNKIDNYIAENKVQSKLIEKQYILQKDMPEWGVER